MTTEERLLASEKLKDLTAKQGAPKKTGFLGRIRDQRSKNR
jgi:hypothetical protein